MCSQNFWGFFIKVFKRYEAPISSQKDLMENDFFPNNVKMSKSYLKWKKLHIFLILSSNIWIFFLILLLTVLSFSNFTHFIHWHFFSSTFSTTSSVLSLSPSFSFFSSSCLLSVTSTVFSSFCVFWQFLFLTVLSKKKSSLGEG